MTPHDLIAAFDVLADAPDGVKRLRELVLSLAVRGKLVAQEAGDEPADVLLARVLEKRTQLIKAKVYTRQPLILPDFDKSEMPYELPIGWSWSCVASLGAVNPRNDVDDDQVVTFAPMTTIPTDYRDQLRAEVRPWFEVKKGYTHFAEGDIGIAKITPCFQNGKGCVFQDLVNGVGAGTTELLVVRPVPDGVVAKYLLVFFKTLDFIEGGVGTFTGTAGQQRVSKDYFSFRPIPVPPLAEQHRIVARVDELMDLLDRLDAARASRDAVRRAARDAALADLREAPDAEAVEAAWGRIARQMDDLFAEPEDVAPLRQAVLQLAVRGRLTGHDTEEWRAANLGDIVVDGPRNGWSPRAVDYPTGVMTLKLSATTKGCFDANEFKYVDGSNGIDERLWLEPGDLLIQRSNTPEYVGTAAIFDGPHRTFIYPDLMMRCRVRPEHAVEFVHLQLSAPSYRSWVSAQASGTSKSMVKVNQATVKSIPLHLPDLQTQNAVVNAARRFLALCDDLEARLTAARDLHGQFAGAAVHHLDA